MLWPIFHCRKTNSEGHGGGDKEKRSRWLYGIPNIIRIYKRENSEKWRPSRLCHFRSARQPAPLLWRRPRSHGHRHDNPGDENPTSGKQGCPEWHAVERRVKNKWGGQRVLLGREIEGLDVWERRGWGKEERKNERHRGKKKQGWRRERSCLLNVGAASRADAEAGRNISPSKPKPLTYSLQ